MKYIIEICVAIDVAILGIAYPILVDKISNIGEKYQSEYLSNVFDLKFPQNLSVFRLSFFQLILILTLLSFIFKILDIPPIDYFKDVYIVENSADILIFCLTILLTISFIIWLNRIVLFQSKTSQLVIYLIKKYENKTEDKNLSKTYYLKTINELTLYAFKNDDPHIGKTLSDFYYKQFMDYRTNNSSNDGPIYPFDLYHITNEIIIKSSENNNRRFSNIGHLASSGIFLLGENFTFGKISQETYRWLWRNLLVSANHKKLIANYWSTASQHAGYSLNLIAPEYEPGTMTITNNDKIKEVEEERRKFLQLNYALGGLLYYLSNYDIIKYILSFSQSQPPRYELLPTTMDDVFYWFDQFANQYRSLEDPIEYKFNFPELDNLGVSGQTTHNICLYISLLFVRQFTLQKIYSYQNFKIFHSLTNDLNILYSYHRRLQYFRTCIEKVLENKELIDTLNYKFDEQEVLATYDTLSQKIKDKIDLTKLQSPISQAKVQQFENETKRILKETFEQYSTINNPTNFRKIDKSITTAINGNMTLSYKSSFTENDIPNFNYDTVHAESISNSKVKFYIPNSFLIARNRRYLIDKKNILKAFQKLIPTLSDEYIIISLCSNYQVEQVINESPYKNIIQKIPYTNNHLKDTFFLLKKKNLPKMEFRDVSSQEIEKFKLKPLDSDIKLYASVLDLNTPDNIDLKNEYNNEDEDDELKVLLLISFIYTISWRSDRDIVMLSLSSPYEERGIESELADIKRLK